MSRVLWIIIFRLTWAIIARSIIICYNQAGNANQTDKHSRVMNTLIAYFQKYPWKNQNWYCGKTIQNLCRDKRTSIWQNISLLVIKYIGHYQEISSKLIFWCLWSLLICKLNATCPSLFLCFDVLGSIVYSDILDFSKDCFLPMTELDAS